MIVPRAVFNLVSFKHIQKASIASISPISTSLSRYFSDQPTIKGQIVDRKSVRIPCEKGKSYSWCSCGLSQKQPLCDGTHKKSECGLKPVRWIAPDTKEYPFCNCKQTKKPPLCDGTHKSLPVT